MKENTKKLLSKIEIKYFNKELINPTLTNIYIEELNNSGVLWDTNYFIHKGCNQISWQIAFTSEMQYKIFTNGNHFIDTMVKLMEDLDIEIDDEIPLFENFIHVFKYLNNFPKEQTERLYHELFLEKGTYNIRKLSGYNIRQKMININTALDENDISDAFGEVSQKYLDKVKVLNKGYNLKDDELYTLNDIRNLFDIN